MPATGTRPAGERFDDDEETPARSEGSPDRPTIRAYLYDAKGSDREVQLDLPVVSGLSEKELLWADVSVTQQSDLREVADWFGLEADEAEDALWSGHRPVLEAGESHFHLSSVIVMEGASGRFEPVEVHAFVSRNWILTVHQSTLDLVGAFNRPIRGETEIGQLDGPVFLSSLLDWALNGYYRVLEDLEDRVDDIDETLLGREIDQDTLLARLVRLRRRITELRRLLAPHREVFAMLAQPDSNAFTPADSSAQFQRLYQRLEKAVEATDNAREMLIGSFDVFMTQTAQRTNEVMKILTLVSVLLLPCGVLAGILGMNFKLGFFNDAKYFWVAIAVMAGMAVTTLVVARRIRWI